MKITEGEQGRFGPRSLKLSLSLSLPFRCSVSLSLPWDLRIWSVPVRSALSESRSIGSWAVWIRSRERNKPRPDSAKTGLLPAATVKKRERERERRDRLYARLKHEDASREYCAPSPCTWRGIKAKWTRDVRSRSPEGGEKRKNSIPVPYQPLRVVNANYREPLRIPSPPFLFFPPPLLFRSFDSFDRREYGMLKIRLISWLRNAWATIGCNSLLSVDLLEFF